MTKQTIRDLDEDILTEDAISTYLANHPDFFERHESVLARLKLPHERGSATVSLVERQVLVLREKIRKLEDKLRELVEVARTNDALSGKIHALSRRLITHRDAQELLEILETSLREDFGASHWLLVLTRTDLDGLGVVTSRHLKLVPAGAPELRTFETFFESARPRCGQIRDTQRDYLFGAETDEIASVALVPIGPGASSGLLAIGSPDSSRFHPAMSTDFLARIGDLLSEAIARL